MATYKLYRTIMFITFAAALFIVPGVPLPAGGVPPVEAAASDEWAAKTSRVHKPLTFVLVHGAWADARYWDETARELRKMGHTVYTPEYAGHGADSNKNATHEQMTQSVVDFITSKDLRNIVLLGHSFGGTIVQKAAEQLPDRIKRLVFFDAFVPLDGQSVADQYPQPVREQFAQLREASGDDTIMLPFSLYRDTFTNTATLDQAHSLYKKVVPEPAGALFQKLDLRKFYSLDIPKSYVYLTEDTALPQGPYGWHPAQSGHLGAYRFIEGTGDHMTTVHAEPRMMARKFIAAGRD